MDKSISETDQALSQMFPNLGKCSLPMPRFGKTSAQGGSLPANDAEADSFCLSWIDEENLGIRMYATAVPGLNGKEIHVRVEGIRPDLFGLEAYVSLTSANGRADKCLSIKLDQQTDDRRGCFGEGSFGTLDDLRKRLGDNVALDVILFEDPKQDESSDEASRRSTDNGTCLPHKDTRGEDIREAERAFFAMFPDTGECSLPIPRFGKTPPTEQSLPASLTEMDSFSLSWVDEENLGIGVFVTAARDAQGIEIRVRVEGSRPDLAGQAAFVSLTSANGRADRSLTIPLTEPTADNRRFTGQGTFGTVEDLRKRLGDKVTLDVFLVDYPPIPKTKR